MEAEVGGMESGRCSETDMQKDGERKGDVQGRGGGRLRKQVQVEGERRR